MIILPERGLSRGKILMPIPRSHWLQRSQREARYSIEHFTSFVITARLHDGKVVWRGKFYDRDDADAFLFAAISGSLQYEKLLWRLPMPEWPGINHEVSYQFVVYTPLTNTAVTSWSVPGDWNNSSGSNSIHCIGGGGSGGAANGLVGNNRAASGGSGAAWSRKDDVTLTPGGSASYSIGTGGAATNCPSGTATVAGNNGNDTTWQTTVCVAKAGLGGTVATGGSDANGPAGGAAASCTGDAKSSGGRGGNATASVMTASGGGGAGGPNGAGAQGVDIATSNTGSAGGQGGNGSGGAGGAAGANNGSAGTDITGSGIGSGGGGGGNAVNTSAYSFGGAGGSYGAGGGGAATGGQSGGNNTLSGSGEQGCIVTAYTPVVVAGGNLAMLGM